jgi:hypothetical protein
MDELRKKLREVLEKLLGRPFESCDQIQVCYPLFEGEEFGVWILLSGTRYGPVSGKTEAEVLNSAIVKASKKEQIFSLMK